MQVPEDAHAGELELAEAQIELVGVRVVQLHIQRQDPGLGQLRLGLLLSVGEHYIIHLVQIQLQAFADGDQFVGRILQVLEQYRAYRELAEVLDWVQHEFRIAVAVCDFLGLLG